MRSLKIGEDARDSRERAPFPHRTLPSNPLHPPNPGTYFPTTLSPPLSPHSSDWLLDGPTLASTRRRKDVHLAGRAAASPLSRPPHRHLPLGWPASSLPPPLNLSSDPLSPLAPSSSSRLPSPPLHCPTACFVRPSERAVLTKLSFSPAPLWSPFTSYHPASLPFQHSFTTTPTK